MRTFVTLFVLAALVTLDGCAAHAKPTLPPKVETPKRPTHVEAADAYRLRAAQAELAEQVARRDAAKAQFDSAERLIPGLNDELLSIWHLFETRYGIDPRRDGYDRNTLEIKWAPRDAAAPVKK